MNDDRVIMNYHFGYEAVNVKTAKIAEIINN